MGNSAPVRQATEFELGTLSKVRSLLEDNSARTTKSLLRRLWGASMPLDATFAVPSPHWRRLGFLQTDPKADLRGGGCLALEQLVFFAEQFPTTFVHLINQVTNLYQRDVPSCNSTLCVCVHA